MLEIPPVRRAGSNCQRRQKEQKMKRICCFFSGFVIAYLLTYVTLRETGNLVIWDYGTAKPEIKTKTGEKPDCLLGVIYYPLILVEWHHPKLHDCLTPS